MPNLVQVLVFRLSISHTVAASDSNGISGTIGTLKPRSRFGSVRRRVSTPTAQKAKQNSAPMTSSSSSSSTFGYRVSATAARPGRGGCPGGGGIDAADPAQALRQQTVTAHVEQHPALRDQHHHDHGHQGQQGPEVDHVRGPADPDRGHRLRDRRAAAQLAVGPHADQHDRHRDVQDRHGADAEQHALRDRLARVPGVLGRGGDQVEPDEGEHDRAGRGEDAHHAERAERRVQDPAEQGRTGGRRARLAPSGRTAGSCPC